MSYRAALDLGKHSAAVSLWSWSGVLAHAAFLEISPMARCRPELVALELRAYLQPFPISDAVLEKMKIYQTRFQKGDQADLLDVQLVVGACGLVLHDKGAIVEYKTAAEWKGDIPKTVTRRRVDEALVASEKERIVWPIGSKKHNLYDAIHLGLREFTKRNA